MYALFQGYWGGRKQLGVIFRTLGARDPKISPKLPESGLWLALDRRLRLGEGSASGVPWEDGLGKGVPHTSALDEERRWVVMNNVPQMNARRMTLTFPVLNAARRVWILCAGSDKKPVLDRLAAGAALPIGRVRPEGERIWWLARSTAGLPPE